MHRATVHGCIVCCLLATELSSCARDYLMTVCQVNCLPNIFKTICRDSQTGSFVGRIVFNVPPSPSVKALKTVTLVVKFIYVHCKVCEKTLATANKWTDLNNCWIVLTRERFSPHTPSEQFCFTLHAYPHCLVSYWTFSIDWAERCCRFWCIALMQHVAHNETSLCMWLLLLFCLLFWNKILLHWFVLFVFLMLQFNLLGSCWVTIIEGELELLRFYCWHSIMSVMVSHFIAVLIIFSLLVCQYFSWLKIAFW